MSTNGSRRPPKSDAKNKPKNITPKKNRKIRFRSQHCPKYASKKAEIGDGIGPFWVPSSKMPPGSPQTPQNQDKSEKTHHFLCLPEVLLNLFCCVVYHSRWTCSYNTRILFRGATMTRRRCLHIISKTKHMENRGTCSRAAARMPCTP